MSDIGYKKIHILLNQWDDKCLANKWYKMLACNIKYYLTDEAINSAFHDKWETSTKRAQTPGSNMLGECCKEGNVNTVMNV